MIRRPPRSTHCISSAASDVYKRQVNTQLGIEQSRRDDMEALGFVFMYFLRGALPWQGIKAETKDEKYRAIRELKASISPETLCKDCPEEFCRYLVYCQKLSFEEKPDYGQLRKMFKDLYVRKGYAYDYVYDWCVMMGHSNNHSIPSMIVGDSKEDIKKTKAEAKKFIEYKKGEKKMSREVHSLDRKSRHKKLLSSSQLNSSKAFV
eukprot:TRINITY_DN10332_c0_g1_i9.p1 TRINITY_DN10332_c0_g1~~TRINITY_DN10332_c0_g1_i9.p1  ORF type:complete len:214 (+),score=61.31 TRINITY_DN10332_c0_g1_i9:25-642(+)